MEQVTIEQLRQGRLPDRKLTMLTAYDYPIAKLVDAAGVDFVLVGDSLGMVVLGYETTEPVTMDEMVHHAKAARRGVSRALLIGDMPLVALRTSPEETLRSAQRFLREAKCNGVKVEWHPGMEQTVARMVSDGVQVMGHVGLTPQTAAQEGGFGMRGKDAASAARIFQQAVDLEAAGCFALVIECVPDRLAEMISQRLRIPTIGIGSGPSCDGQVLVTYDLLGLCERLMPRFAKRYISLAPMIQQAAAAYVRDVHMGVFPSDEQTRSMAPAAFTELQRLLAAHGAS